MNDDSADREPLRRRILGSIAATGLSTGVAGCLGIPGSDSGSPTDTPSRGTPDANRAPGRIVEEGRAVGLETVATGVRLPTDLASPDGERLFVTDQFGPVYAFTPDESGSPVVLQDRSPVLDLSDQILTGNEAGLLGLAFHPDFADNGRLFVRYSAPPGETTPDRYHHVEVLAEFRAPGDRSTVDPDSERILLEIPQPSQHHNSGDVLFGPDGYCYLTTGDGGDFHEDDTLDGLHLAGASQNLENLLGGVLRIDVDERSSPADREGSGQGETEADGDGSTGQQTGDEEGSGDGNEGGSGGENEEGSGDEEGEDGNENDEEGRLYGIPPDNPFAGAEWKHQEYYAWGFRNPWGVSFDGDDLYVADVGARQFEWVNRVEKGGNYGWSVQEGTNCFDPRSPLDPLTDCLDRMPLSVRDGEPFLDPVIEYPHEHEDADGEVGFAIVGGYVYRGDLLPDLRGEYVFGDLRGHLFVASPPDDDEALHPFYRDRDLWPIRELDVATEDRGREVPRDEEEEEGRGNVRGSHVYRSDVFLPVLGRLDGELYAGTTYAFDARDGNPTGEVHRIVPHEE